MIKQAADKQDQNNQERKQYLFSMQYFHRADNQYYSLVFLLYFCAMSRSFISLMLVLVLFCHTSFGQYNQYELRGKSDLGLFISSTLMLGGGLYIKSNATPPGYTAINGLSTTEVNAFDRLVFELPDKNRLLLSDLMVGSLATLPASLLFFKDARDDFLPLALIFYQTVTFTYGLTTMVKGLSGRYRPYTYKNELSMAEKTTLDAGESFFSGHTSSAAAMAFASASTLTAYVDSPVWDKIIWGAAITIPAYTGYLRMVSRKHFPTDVIAGYAVGASVGWLIPHLHRVKHNGDSPLTLDVRGNFLYLGYSF